MSKEFAKDYTVYELIAATIARNLDDGEIGYIGVGTGGKSVVLAIGVPFVACGLAQMTHAPNFVIFDSFTFNYKMDEVPSSLTESKILKWRSQARVETFTIDPCYIQVPKRWMKNGVTFSSGAQVDMYGNLNATVIGDYYKPKVRLIGSLAQPHQLANSRKSFIVQEHEKRAFVPKVDFITSVGYYDGPGGREKASLSTPKIMKVFTDLAVLGFDERTKRMKIESVHPGETAEKVQKNTGFELIIPNKVPVTEPPTVSDVNIMREKIDPRGLFLKPAELSVV